MKGDTNKTNVSPINHWNLTNKNANSRKTQGFKKISQSNLTTDYERSGKCVTKRTFGQSLFKFLGIISMINTFMFKQRTAKINTSLTYIKSSEKQYNNLNERTRKSFSTSPPLYIKIHSGKKNDKTDHRGRACPLRHKRTTQIKLNHYTIWS